MNNVNRLEHKLCTGCRSCEQSCPKKAIKMVEDNEGFIYPKINSLCIECGICIKKCHMLTSVERGPVKDCYAVILKDKNILQKSASGGAFAAFASFFLDEKGFVFGSSYDEKLNVHQICIDNKKDLNKLQGSKYVSSDTLKTFSEVREKLEKGEKVLYSGTPCQIAGLKAFLGKECESDNLLTIDLVCHGTPSQLLFTKYIEWLGKKYNGKVIYYGFRDKDVSGWNCCGKIRVKTKKTKTKTKILEASCDPYYASFLRAETYRYSCYECKYSCPERVGDLTICDFWGVEKYYPKIDRNEGVSGVITNTEKGKVNFNMIRNTFLIQEITFSELSDLNKNLKIPSKLPSERNDIYVRCLVDNSFKPNIKYYNYLHFRLRKYISNIIPTKFKRIIKKLLR